MSDFAPRPGSDEEWEELLRQLRRRPGAAPRPFFYARVHAQLLARAGAAQAWLPGWLRRPAYAAVLGALVLAVSGDNSAAATARTSPGSHCPAHQQPR